MNPSRQLWLAAVGCFSIISCFSFSPRSVVHSSRHNFRPCRVIRSLASHDPTKKSKLMCMTQRRKALSTFLGGLSGTFFYTSDDVARGAWLLPSKERRQLELCVVNLLRVQYWAEAISIDLQTVGNEDRRKQLYLEARLGAKALVAGKAGGGATSRVYNLVGLQFRDCLDDIVWYGKSRQVTQLKEDLVESLASVVEFDGLETTQDASPRSSLTLSKWSAEKELFVRRMLSEGVVPTAKSLVDAFGPETRSQCEAYIKSNFPNEIPRKSDPIPVSEISEN